MSRPLSSHSSQPQHSALSAAKALSLNLKGCSHQLSSTALFVTNLRLLDFDLYDDWPEITVQTFATKDAQQNQKKRIQCTEWALFRLFELWDPDETREKLAPFFPPLEPLQSLNLRGALYRCLNDLKKNGVLGREAVLRKTMLDECKGDKFMEILVVFSTAVIRKKISGRKSSRKNLPVARQYATASSLSLDQQASLLPLAIAHKAALTNVLRRRDDLRERYMDFGDLLEQKSLEAVQRNEKCGEILETLEQSGKDLPDAASIKRILHDNWLGNPEWLEVMVQGDQPESEGGLFQMQFEELWERVQLGEEIEEQTTHHQSLLQDLEARVRGQEKRLARWKAFHEKIQASRSEEPAPKAPKNRSSSIDFTFDRHQELRIGRTAPPEPRKDDDIYAASDLTGIYGSILANMRDDLAAASKVKSGRPPPKFTHKPKPSAIPMQPEIQRPTFASRPRARSRPVEPPSPEPEKQSKPTFDRPISPDWFSPLSKPQDPTSSYQHENGEPIRSLSPRPTKPTLKKRHTFDEYSSEPEEDARGHLSSRSPPPPPPPGEEPASPRRPRSPSPSIPSSPPNPEDLLAEQILAGIDAASPSPVKQQQQQQQQQQPPSYNHHQQQHDYHRPSLTLMERTRLTMEGHTVSPAKPGPAPRPLDPEQQAKADATAALIERTRQTMLAMAEKGPTPSQQQQQQSSNAKGRARSKTVGNKRGGGAAGGASDRRRRSSLFPPNPWETRKVSPLFEEWADRAARMEEEEEEEEEGKGEGSRAGRKTPTDRLFEEGVDEESVFKSRPRIAASPVFGAEGEEGEGVSEVEVGGGEVDVDGDGDEDEDESGLGGWESSPLRRKGR